MSKGIVAIFTLATKSQRILVAPVEVFSTHELNKIMCCVWKSDIRTYNNGLFPEIPTIVEALSKFYLP